METDILSIWSYDEFIFFFSKKGFYIEWILINKDFAYTSFFSIYIRPYRWSIHDIVSVTVNMYYQ